jgi:hypothetical protein
MKRSILPLIALILLCCPVIAATDKELADAAYKNAISAFNQKNYTGTYNLAHEARELYLNINDTASMDRCDQLISNLPPVLEPAYVRICRDFQKIYESGDYINARKILIK